MVYWGFLLHKTDGWDAKKVVISSMIMFQCIPYWFQDPILKLSNTNSWLYVIWEHDYGFCGPKIIASSVIDFDFGGLYDASWPSHMPLYYNHPASISLSTHSKCQHWVECSWRESGMAGIGRVWNSPLLLTCISNYIHYKVCDEITCPFLNFNGATVEF